MDTLSDLLRTFIDHSEGEIRRLRREIDAATRALSYVTDTPPLPREVAETLNTITPNTTIVYSGQDRTLRRVPPRQPFYRRPGGDQVSPLTLAALSGSYAFHSAPQVFTDTPIGDYTADVLPGAGTGALPEVLQTWCPTCHNGPLHYRADDVLICTSEVHYNLPGPWLFDLCEISTYEAIPAAAQAFPQHYAAVAVDGRSDGSQGRA